MRIFGYLSVACMVVALLLAVLDESFLGANGVVWLFAGFLSWSFDQASEGRYRVGKRRHEHHHHDHCH